MTNFYETDRSIIYTIKGENDYLLIEHDKLRNSHNTVFKGTLSEICEYLKSEIDYLNSLIKNTLNEGANKIYTMFISIYNSIMNELTAHNK